MMQKTWFITTAIVLFLFFYFFGNKRFNFWRGQALQYLFGKCQKIQLLFHNKGKRTPKLLLTDWICSRERIKLLFHPIWLKRLKLFLPSSFLHFSSVCSNKYAAWFCTLVGRELVIKKVMLSFPFPVSALARRGEVLVPENRHWVLNHSSVIQPSL